MEIVKIISTHKRLKVNRLGNDYKITHVKEGMRRVMAIVNIGGEMVTRHIEVPLKA